MVDVDNYGPAARNDRFGGKVFISDIHGQKDVLDYLSDQDFGLIKLLVERACAGHCSKSCQAEVERFLSGGNDSHTVSADALHAMMKVLIDLKSERSFWQICIKHCSNSEWVSAKLNELASEEALDDQCLYELPSLEAGERLTLASRIAAAVRELLDYRINVVGDIYDRGADAFAVMEDLAQRKNVRIQWGNHDVVWLGAAAGSLACVDTVVRLCLRYGTLPTLESDYGVDLSALERLAVISYADDDCLRFSVAKSDGTGTTGSTDRCGRDSALLAKMHKAIAVIQFKLEDQLLERNHQFRMGDRRLLHKIDVDAGSIELGNESIPLEDTEFPTLDERSPSAMSDQEWATIEELRNNFVSSDRLSQHMEYLLSNGAMYAVDGRYLMFHGCVPLNEDGTLMALEVEGIEFTGRCLFNALERQLREAYSRRHSQQCHHLSDVAWYLWCGPASPLFGKEKMTTFERYFIADKRFHKEGKNRYFSEREKPAFIERLSQEFGGPDGCIVVNGHVPVRVSSGESPIKADGRMICIDGGFARPYRKVTGISGLALAHGCGAARLYGVEERGSGFGLFEVADAAREKSGTLATRKALF